MLHTRRRREVETPAFMRHYQGTIPIPVDSGRFAKAAWLGCVIRKGMGASRCLRVMATLLFPFLLGEVHLQRWCSPHSSCGIVGMFRRRWRALTSFWDTQCLVCGWTKDTLTGAFFLLFMREDTLTLLQVCCGIVISSCLPYSPVISGICQWLLHLLTFPFSTLQQLLLMALSNTQPRLDPANASTTARTSSKATAGRSILIDDISFRRIAWARWDRWFNSRVYVFP